MDNRSAPRLLLIGWDAADWRFIRSLLKQGQMPALQKLMDEGAWGSLATQQPVLSPMLWTTIATGKRPHQHGIHGFIEPMPDGKGMRPSVSTSRSCKALWNIATQSGLHSNVVGWYCSHPAEPIKGVCVSDSYHRVTSEQPEEWKIPADAIHPESLCEALRDLRIHPTELVAEQLLAFVPGAAQIDQTKDRRLAVVAKLFCEMVSIHSAATWLMENEPWEFMAVYHTAIDHFGHYFMQFHPPKMEAVSDEQYELYKDVMVSCYRFHDMMLARLMQLAGEETNVILCSDHGFYHDRLRPRRAPVSRVNPAAWHRPYGIVCMRGPGVRSAERIYGASILDIAPTALALLGLPIGEDMDGKPLLPVLTKDYGKAGPPRLPSWETESGEAGMHPPDKREDPLGSMEAMRRLIDLGYIEKPDPNAERDARRASDEGRFNLAIAYLDAGHVAQATELLELMWNDESKESSRLRYGAALVWACLAARQFDKARANLQQVLERAKEAARQYAQQLEKRRQAIQERALQRREEPNGSHARTPEQLQAMAQALEAAQQRLRTFDPTTLPRVQLLLGILEMAAHNPEQALVHLTAAERADDSLLALKTATGRVYLRLKRANDAHRAFSDALKIDPDSALAHSGMAAALLRLARPRQAVHHALRATELLYQYPQAHYRLGMSLARIGEFDRAIDALETCSKMAPMSVRPLRRLMRLYRRVDEPYLADICMSKIDAIRQMQRGKRRPVAADRQAAD